MPLRENPSPALREREGPAAKRWEGEGTVTDHHQIPPLPTLLIEPLIRNALLEDLGRAGDITTDAIVPASAHARASFVLRQPGTICGLDLARLAFHLIDQAIVFEPALEDGDTAPAGTTIARVSGPARGILTAERVALNFMGRLSGIATATSALAAVIRPHPTRIVCTRKTTPGLRSVEKYAVRCGGGLNHRFGLDDAILIKDNHIALAGGIRPAMERALAHAGHLVKIEIEVDTLAQLEEVLPFGPDAILLDNMTHAQLTQAVHMVARRAITEASGGITPATAAAIAATGVDLISAGWLTHSTPVLDIGLDI